MYSYSEFILETHLKELILESKINYSEDFKRLLNAIDSKVAKELLRLNNSEQDVAQNYIDIDMSNNTMVSFIQDKRAKQMMEGVKEEYQLNGDAHLKYEKFKTEKGDQANRDIYSRVGMTFEEVNRAQVFGEKLAITGETIVKLSGNVFVSYRGVEDETIRGVVKKDKLTPVQSEVYEKLWTTGRNSMRSGRLAKAVLNASGLQVSDKDIEDFVNKFKSHIDILNDAFAKFDVITDGKEIVHFYSSNNYDLSKDSGTLGSSCMANVPGSYFSIYKDNPKKVSLVVLYDDNGKSVNGEYKSDKIVGRAVLWKTDSGFEFMDRVYYTKDSDRDLFNKFAERSGFWYKLSNDHDRGTVTISNGKLTKAEKIVVSLDNFRYDEFPYLDSLMYFNSATGKVSSSRKDVEADVVLNGTCGNDHEGMDGSYDDGYYDEDY